MFRPLELSDKELFMSYTLRGDYRNVEAGFACAYIWRHKYNHEIYTTNNAMYIKFNDGEADYVTPFGVRNWRKAMEELDALDPGASLGELTGEDVAAIEEAVPGRYEFIENRNITDYLYLQSELAEFSGKKFHSKRNFCSRFEREYEGRWRFEEITEKNIDDVWLFHDAWSRKNGGSSSLTLQEESTTIALLLYNLNTLGARGGLLRANGKVVAFTAGAPVSRDTYDVSVEKADYDIVGAYPMICREFVRNVCNGYQFINREDDMGLENLRKAKLSYNPVMLINKYNAFKR